MARKIGIMQGRLSPPVDGAIQAFPLSTWREEFSAAKEAALNHIEWIFDREDLLNPIANHSGIIEMQALKAQTGMEINSLCADYFMSERLLHDSAIEREARAAKFKWLLAQCELLGIRHVVLPFVDRSKVESAAEIEQLTSLIKTLLPALASHHTELHLETSLAPRPFASLLQKIGDPLVKINYDVGNSAALGYDLSEEFEAYGPSVGSIHIKDRMLGGTTVPLGRGNADFLKLVRGVEKIDYQGDFILQVARDKQGDEIAWARHNLDFAESLLSKIN
jgi:L-ribulose-5-phosphate 3-epimerase